MQRLTPGSARSGDRGAVAVVFALTLIVLIGFVGLAVDVGSAYAKAQEVQNAADAGALAIAQECADAEPECVAEAKRALAGDLADSNIRAGYDPSTLPDVNFPAANRVTVTVAAESTNYFATLFGYKTFAIERRATAQWDAPQAGPATIPLTISMCSFYRQAGAADGTEEPVPNLGKTLEIWVPQSPPGADEKCQWPGNTYPPGGFGWLDVNKTCQVDINLDVDPWLGGDPGASPPNCLSGLLTELKVGHPLTFLVPIYEATNGQGGQGAEYKVARFAALQLEGVQIQQGNVENVPVGFKCERSKPANPPGKKGKYYSDTCLRGTFVDWVEIGEDYTGGAPVTEVSVVRLVDPVFEDSKP